jgi:hypothetical protein
LAGPLRSAVEGQRNSSRSPCGRRGAERFFGSSAESPEGVGVARVGLEGWSLGLAVPYGSIRSICLVESVRLFRSSLGSEFESTFPSPLTFCCPQNGSRIRGYSQITRKLHAVSP